MVAGENPEAAGIIGNRFVKSKLGREIRDWSFDGRAGSHFSISVLTHEIISKSVMDLLELAQKIFVLGKLFQSGLTRELEHADWIVVGPVPKIGIEMTEKTTG